jgi:CRP/FNR family transcriptional regulator, polysaccharide utilization system transcription regulator
MIREIPNCESCHVQKLTCFSFMKPDELADLKYEKSCSLYRRGQIIFQEDNRAMGVYC